VLAMEYIHHENSEVVCLLCHLHSKLDLSKEEKAKLEFHEYVVRKQSEAFQRDIRRVLESDGKIMLLVQDFTQITIQDTLTQCLIFTLYFTKR